jgi:hypothetical protein
MCSPFRGDTVDDTVQFGTYCLLLATSVAEKRAEAVEGEQFPWAGMPRGTFLFPRSLWGIARLTWSYTNTSTGEAAGLKPIVSHRSASSVLGAKAG